LHFHIYIFKVASGFSKPLSFIEKYHSRLRSKENKVELFAKELRKNGCFHTFHCFLSRSFNVVAQIYCLRLKFAEGNCQIKAMRKVKLLPYDNKNFPLLVGIFAG